MNILKCVFTYNRPALLANAVASIDRFFPWGDGLVVDDGSDDPAVAACLDMIEARPNWRCLRVARTVGQSHGGFYRNMALALRQALDGSYDHCLFFEDDEQFVWQRNDYPEFLGRAFATCPDCIMVQPLFQRRIHDYSNVELIEPVGLYRTDRGFTTTGFWNMAALRRHSDYDVIHSYGGQSHLPPNSAYWLRQGYRLYFEAEPTVAIMPWAASGAARHPSAGGADPARNLLLRPLDDEQVGFLRGRDLTLPCFQEYFLLSDDNWRQPIWHQFHSNMQRYYQLCRQAIQREDLRRQAPPRVPSVPDWRPSQTAPEQSHLTWEARVRSTAMPERPGWKRFLHRNLPRGTVEWIRCVKQDGLRYRAGFEELARRLRREQAGLPYGDRFVREGTL